MMISKTTPNEIKNAVEKTVAELVRSDFISGAFFVNLPMLYPDGSFVTIRISRGHQGLRVSDAGFAYREADDLSVARSFRRAAKKASEQFGVEIGEYDIFADATVETLQAAIMDVAAASWKVAEDVCQKAFNDDEEALSDSLAARLEILFGTQHVEKMQPVSGASSSQWPVSAVVKFPDHYAVFQAVSDHANSIYRTATAFHDIAALPRPPRLIAVVRDKKALGPKLALLSQSGRVIEEGQTDDLFKRAAA